MLQPFFFLHPLANQQWEQMWSVVLGGGVLNSCLENMPLKSSLVHRNSQVFLFERKEVMNNDQSYFELQLIQANIKVFLLISGEPW